MTSIHARTRRNLSEPARKCDAVPPPVGREERLLEPFELGIAQASRDVVVDQLVFGNEDVLKRLVIAEVLLFDRPAVAVVERLEQVLPKPTVGNEVLTHSNPYSAVCAR